MTIRSISISTATAAFLLVLAPPPAQAQVRQATVDVAGMACPFCAYGLEKRLRKVEGVDSVEVELKEGRATLNVGEGSSIDLPAVVEAVHEAGFTPGRLEATAEGTIRFDPDADGSGGYVVEAPDGEPLLLLVNLSAEQSGQVEELLSDSESIAVTGEVHFHTDALSGLEPVTIEAIR